MQQHGRIGGRTSDAPRSRCRNIGLLLAVGWMSLAACSSTDGGGDIGAAPPSLADGDGDGDVESVDAGPDFVPTPDENPGAGADGSTTTAFDLAAQPTTPPIAPIPETGVPGIDSSNAFCRAWSEFAGSFQALGLTSAIGDPSNADRLEVIAASSVTAAVEMMQLNLPDELETERGALIADFAGPFFTRALVAEAELAAAGVEPDQLRDLWIRTLTEAGVDDPFISVELPAGVDTEAFDAAVASFSDVQPAIVDDPTLVTDASIPATETYLADVCPDGGILSGNDDIGS